MTLRLDLEYDGTDFAGWQVQPGERTVQGALEDAFAILWRASVAPDAAPDAASGAASGAAPFAVHGSGRTDAGVHARGQVAHVVVPEALRASFDAAARTRLTGSLAGLLPHDIALTALTRAPDGFHARYDAVRRTYHYRISTVPRALDRRTRVLIRAPGGLDIAAMNAAAAPLLGRHHFGAFCRAQSATTNRVCALDTLVWEPDGCGGDGDVREGGDWRLRVSADRFLHGMVRALAGTLLLVGRGRLDGAALPGILASRDRRRAGPAAPPHGLVLERVEYRG